MQSGRNLLRRSLGQFRADLRRDPYLLAILVLALVLAAFGVWHRIPNFATWDGRDRLFHPLVVYGHVLADPSFESLQEGLAWSREPFGATFYFYSIALLPILVAATFTGALDAIAELPFHDPSFGFLAAWQATPRWIWTWGILLARLVNVAFAVGCVYLVYRLGVAVWDRTTGRLAATFLTLTFAFLMLAKEIGEDVPAVFFLLLSLNLLVRYVQTGTDRYLYAGSAVGGFALAVKLTMGPIAFLVPAAVSLRARSEGSEEWLRAVWRPRLLGAAAAAGLFAFLLGFPAAVGGRFDLLAERLVFNTGSRIISRKGPVAPTWWWFLRGYLHAFGLPLAVAGFAGVIAGFHRLREWPSNAPSVALLSVGLVLFLTMFGTWMELRVHHLLPTMPLILLLLAGTLSRLHANRAALARTIIAVLLLTTAAYAGAGTVQYASMPRDQAHDWIEANVPREATMEIYQETMDNAVVTHDLDVSHPWDEPAAACPEYLQLTYRDLAYLRDVPPEHRPHHVAGNVSARAAYMRAIVDGETNYELVAEFGSRPPNFVPRRDAPGSVVDVIDNGVYPHSDQFGDEQDLAASQYVAIFERTAPCDGERSVPW